MFPLKQFKCSICGASCPKEYLAHSKFSERMTWLRRHYKRNHPRAFRAGIRKGVKARE